MNEPKWPDEVTWTVPPENQGHPIEVAFGMDEQGNYWMREIDRCRRNPDLHRVTYQQIVPTDPDSWEPRSRAPKYILLFRIGRSFGAPLVFTGEMLAESQGDRTVPRRHDLRIYRTTGGAYVVEVEYVTQWEGERNVTEAEVAEEPAAVLRAYDPTRFVKGFPPRPEFEQKQQNLMDWVRRRYEIQVGEVLAEAGIEERIE